MADTGAIAVTSGTAASETTAAPRVEGVWRPLDGRHGRKLSDARLQLHHAAQLVAGLGISYIPRRDDDSHTNMEWLPAFNALASNPVGDRAFRLAIRPRNLNLIALEDGVETDCFMLATRTIGEAVEWIRRTTTQHGLDSTAYTTAKHYAIPPHPVGEGRPFNAADREEFEQLDHWYSNAAVVLERVAAQRPDASPVRCWPHHLDIATLIALDEDCTIGVGLEPGDEYYGEPYFYVNVYPSPSAAALEAARPSLGGNGLWHSRGWVGAVLPASRIGAPDELEQCMSFIESAIAACVDLIASTR